MINGEGRAVYRGTGNDLELRAVASDATVHQGIRVPGAVYNRLKAELVDVHLDYAFTSFRENATYAMPARDGRQRMPGIGWCATKVNDAGTQVLFRCLQPGERPSCLALVLEHIPTGRRNPEVSMCAPDYSPYLAQLSGVDVVVQGFAGSNPLKFMKQYKDAGLTLPVLGGGPACDDALLKSFGDEAIGLITATAYTSDLASPINKKFVEGMIRDTGNTPGLYAAGMYIDGMVAEAALEKTGGKTDDRDKLIEALRGVSLTDSPRGPFHFDHFGNVIGNIYIRRCEKKDGKLVNTTIKTYPDVSQFWTYDEKWFLSQPVYSRDYPALKS